MQLRYLQLGSDEEQIVYLLYAIHDVQHNKVFFFHLANWLIH